ncbi:MAG: hypothetical protein RL142_263 [Actinomycetota bacterium]|jgi:integral membrane protein
MTNQPSLLESVSKTLRLYKIAANITGYFLLVITVLYVIRLATSTDLFLAGPHGVLWFETFALVDGDRVGLPTTGINLTSIILIVHGWVYVFYLYIDFRLWSLLQWSLGRFLLIAAGGVVPLLSFFAESYYQKIAAADLEKMKG